MTDVKQPANAPDPAHEESTASVGPTELDQDLVRSAWTDQARWSKAAGGLKTLLGRWRLIAAIGGVAGALLTTAAAALPNETAYATARTWLALAGAFVLATVAVILRTQLSQERIEAWVRARSASEALKEEIYRYLIGATPYGPQRSVELFGQRRQEQREKVRDLSLEAAAVTPPPVKNRPLQKLTSQDYIQLRVNGQIDGYYLDKAAKYARMAKRLRNLEFILVLAAAGLGVFASGTVGAGGLSGLGSWVAVLTTAGAAVTSFLAAGRYDLQAITFYGTADRLTTLRDAFQADGTKSDPERISRFVDDVENAISSENEAWLAGWSHEENKPDKP